MYDKLNQAAVNLLGFLIANVPGYDFDKGAEQLKELVPEPTTDEQIQMIDKAINTMKADLQAQGIPFSDAIELIKASL